MTGEDNLRMLRDRAIERQQRLLANLFGRPSPVPSFSYLQLTQQRIADIEAALHGRSGAMDRRDTASAPLHRFQVVR